MKLTVKKPIILKLKMEVVILIRNKCILELHPITKHPMNYYWTGDFIFEDKIIHIYWQNYIKRKTVNYIHIQYKEYEGRYGVNIQKKELLRIKKELV